MGVGTVFNHLQIVLLGDTQNLVHVSKAPGGPIATNPVMVLGESSRVVPLGLFAHPVCGSAGWSFFSMVRGSASHETIPPSSAAPKVSRKNSRMFTSSDD